MTPALILELRDIEGRSRRPSGSIDSPLLEKPAQTVFEKPGFAVSNRLELFLRRTANLILLT
jgi:hypothetical protein